MSELPVQSPLNRPCPCSEDCRQLDLNALGYNNAKKSVSQLICKRLEALMHYWNNKKLMKFDTAQVSNLSGMIWDLQLNWKPVIYFTRDFGGVVTCTATRLTRWKHSGMWKSSTTLHSYVASGIHNGENPVLPSTLLWQGKASKARRVFFCTCQHWGHISTVHRQSKG